MKQYLLFCGDAYYPGGGWDDFHADFSSQEEAVNRATTIRQDWWQVVDTSTMKIVADGGLR